MVLVYKNYKKGVLLKYNLINIYDKKTQILVIEIRLFF